MLLMGEFFSLNTEMDAYDLKLIHEFAFYFDG